MAVELSDKLQRAQNYWIRFVFNLKHKDQITSFYNQVYMLLMLNQLTKYYLKPTFVVVHHLNNFLSEQFIFISQIS